MLFGVVEFDLQHVRIDAKLRQVIWVQNIDHVLIIDLVLPFHNQGQLVIPQHYPAHVAFVERV